MTDWQPSRIIGLPKEVRDSYVSLAMEASMCSIQDCPSQIETWMVTEMAPGRPLVYGVCERDAALIHMQELRPPEAGE